MNIPTFISLLRNAILANKSKITISHKFSKKLLNFLDVCIENIYILTYYQDNSNNLHIIFYEKPKTILEFKHISKPSKPVYFSYKDLWKFKTSLGLIILTTPKGIISHQTAIHLGLGGEALCFIR